LIFNNELIIPLVESLGLRGVIFFDAGNAFSAAEGYDMNEMRLSYGPGVRWMSPIGPLRIEVGFPINRKRGDDEQRVMFSFGGPP
jgi:outer membrane protein insertion porin family